MSYIIENGEITRVYNIVCDKNKLMLILNKLISECSYGVKCKFTLKASEVKFGYNNDLSYRIRGFQVY